MAIAYSKKALESAGGFNENLEIYEFTELSVRFKSSKFVKTPDLTFLHLEPAGRFTLRGYLGRRMQWGFWHHVLFYLYPRRLTIFAFPVKLVLLLGASLVSLILGSYLPFVIAVAVYIAWLPFHMNLFKAENPTKYAMSQFPRRTQKLEALAISLCVSMLADLSSEVGKTWGILKSPVRLQQKRQTVTA